MRAKLLLSAFAVASVMTTAHADYLFTTQFNSGRIPAIMSASAGENSPQVVTTDYRQGVDTQGRGWAVAMASTKYEYSAVCASHTQTDAPMDATLSTPEFTVAGNRPMLRWSAMSIYPSKPEAYKVTVLEKDATEPVVIFESGNTPGQWRDYAVDLSQFMGKTVTVNFVCTSVNKYMLAIDNIYAGDPEDSRFQFLMETPSFDYAGAFNETTPVKGSIINMGTPVAAGSLVLRYGEDNEELEVALPENWQCGDEFEFDFKLPVSLGETVTYTLGVKKADEEFTALKEGKVVCSHYPRTLLVDEFTGLWCNNCPGGLLELEELEAQFGNHIIGLGVHMATGTNDVFQIKDYVEANRVYSVPWLMINRIYESGSASPRYFDKYYEDPTVSMIEITDYNIEGDDLTVKARVHWAEDLDNSDDRYRVGYVLTRNVHADADIKPLYQKNSLNGVKYGRYNILPQNINSDLTELPNVVLTSEFAHTGRPYTIPANIPAMQYADTEFNLTKPEPAEAITWPSVKDFSLKDCRIVAYIIDTADGNKVLNAVAQNLNEPAPKPTSVKLIEDGMAVDTDAAPEYFNLQGMKVANPEKGIFIERRGSKVTKIVK